MLPSPIVSCRATAERPFPGTCSSPESNLVFISECYGSSSCHPRIARNPKSPWWARRVLVFFSVMFHRAPRAPQPVKPGWAGSTGPSADDGGAATPLAATTEVPRCRDDGVRVNNRLVDLGVRRGGPSKAPSHLPDLSSSPILSTADIHIESEKLPLLPIPHQAFV